MAAEWFVKIGDKTFGPAEPSQLKKWAAEGKFTPEAFVKKGEAGQWTAAGNVKGLFSNSPPTPPVAPPAAPPITEQPVFVERAEQPPSARKPSDAGKIAGQMLRNAGRFIWPYMVRYWHKPKTRNDFFAWLLILGLVAVSIVRMNPESFFIAGFEADLARRASHKRATVAPAKKAEPERLSSPGDVGAMMDNVPAAISRSAFSRLTQLSVAKDYMGIEQLENDGQFFTIKKGTRVRLISRRGFLAAVAEVRIISGPFEGYAVFVDPEHTGKNVVIKKPPKPSKPLNENYKIFGSWVDGNPFVGSTITMSFLNGKTSIVYRFKDGSNMKREIKEDPNWTGSGRYYKPVKPSPLRRSWHVSDDGNLAEFENGKRTATMKKFE